MLFFSYIQSKHGLTKNCHMLEHKIFWRVTTFSMTSTMKSRTQWQCLMKETSAFWKLNHGHQIILGSKKFKILLPNINKVTTNRIL